tara:strand:- start:22 stop:357 length:336 start_codon:yes stop_codon:yes gene_type:complete
VSKLTITKSAAAELLRQSVYRGKPGEIYIYLQPDIFGEGWLYIRIDVGRQSGIPIAITDGVIIFAPESQISLLEGLTLDHYQDLTGGGFLISTPKDAQRSTCGSGFKLKVK